MLVNAIYDHGKIIWPDNVKLKEDKASLIVDVPDEVIEVDDFLEAIDNKEVKQLMYDLRKIRGTGPVVGDHRSDKELLFDAFRMMEQDNK